MGNGKQLHGIPLLPRCNLGFNSEPTTSQIRSSHHVPLILNTLKNLEEQALGRNVGSLWAASCAKKWLQIKSFSHLNLNWVCHGEIVELTLSHGDSPCKFVGEQFYCLTLSSEQVENCIYVDKCKETVIEFDCNSPPYFKLWKMKFC